MITLGGSKLDRAAIIAFRLIIFAALGWILLQIGIKISGILMAVLVAIILTSLLSPIANSIHKKFPINRYVITVLVMTVVLGAIGAVVGLAAKVMIEGSNDLVEGISTGLKKVQDFLLNSPFDLDPPGLETMTSSIIDWTSKNSEQLASGVLAAGGSVTSFLAMAAIALMSTLFFVADGRTVALWTLRFVPEDSRLSARRAAGRAWRSLKLYARSQIVVAGVDAIGIAVGALIIGVPFVIPIGVLVFFASFIPIVGALLSGAIAVLIALAFGGLVKALIMLGVILLVQQLEGNVWSPLLLGGAVSIHPWAVFIGVAAGTYMMGILGALLAVPVMATINSAFLSTKKKPKKKSENKLRKLFKKLTDKAKD